MAVLALPITPTFLTQGSAKISEVIIEQSCDNSSGQQPHQEITNKS
jgi:hypothetical protein